MKVTQLGFETLFNNLRKCEAIVSLLHSASLHEQDPQQIQSWEDELVTLVCLIEDTEGLLNTEFKEI